MSYQQGHHPLFQWTEEERKEILEEVGIKESDMIDDVDAILDWFQKQPHLVEAGLDRDLAERMVLIAKGSREKAKRRLDNYYKYRKFAPELMLNREKVLSGDGDIWTFHRQILIPKLYKNKRITVIDFTDLDPSHFVGEILFRNSLLFADMRLKYDYLMGEIWIINLKGIGLGHLIRMNPLILQKAAHIFQEGLGLRIFGIHVLNAPSIAQQILKFFRQFVIPKIMDRVVIHDSIDDLKKCIPVEFLPEDYGGTQPSMEEFRLKTEKELIYGKTKQHLIDCMKMVSDERQRRGYEEGDEEYLTGSFKQLDFD